jgi:hypothetical protein
LLTIVLVPAEAAMLDAPCKHLLEKPGLYQSKMIVILQDEFDVLVTTSLLRDGLRKQFAG